MSERPIQQGESDPYPGRMTSMPTRARGGREARFEERRTQLALSALDTLAELGYAQTSLRDIAQHSEFTHGVVHYYFADKVELISHCVRVFHDRLVSRFDDDLASYHDLDEMGAAVAAKLVFTLTEETAQHRLWYDLRAQSMFNEVIREDVRQIEASLEGFAWRIVLRYAELSGTTPVVDSATNYRMYDGIFQNALLDHLAGVPDAAERVVEQTSWLMQQICPCGHR